MYIDIDANDNISEATMATFKETGASVPIRAIRLEVDGAWQWCAVVGWSESGASPALLTPIEESGDGPARLLHGSDQGLRLARIADQDDATEIRWSIREATQWGEPFVICRPETLFVPT